MNDNFLYELRSQPSPQFAASLKARLDLQASETRQKRRAFKWFVCGAILMGGTALAFVSPSVRQAAWTMVVQFRGSAAPDEDVVRDRGQMSNVDPAKEAPSTSDMAPELDRSAGNTTPASAESRDMQDPAEARPASGPASSVPAASADGREISVVGGASRGATVTIAHSKSMVTLATNFASDLGNRFRMIRFTTLERPDAASCASDFQSRAVDLLITDERISEDALARCSPRGQILEIRLAYQAIALVIHRENQWARIIAMEDLEKFRNEHQSTPFTTWSQLRSDWPTIPIRVSASRSAAVRRFVQGIGLSGGGQRYMMAVSDDATMQMVEVVNDANMIGVVEWQSLYAMHKLHSEWPIAAAVSRGGGEPIAPTVATISEGRYPLAQPIWVYVAASRLDEFGIWSALPQLFSTSLGAKAIERSGFVGVGPDDQERAMRLLTDASPRNSRR